MAIKFFQKFAIAACLVLSAAASASNQPGIPLSSLGAPGGVAKLNSLGYLDPFPVIPLQGFNPRLHLQKFNAASTPNICIMGDSTSTVSSIGVAGPANIAADELLWPILIDALRRDNPTKTLATSQFVNRAIGGQTWSSAANTASSNLPSWYINPGFKWLPFVQAANCTTLFMNFGVNENADNASNIETVLANVAGWGTAPATWQASHSYALNSLITDSNGMIEIAGPGGTSGSSAPTWPGSQNGAVTDGTVTWTRLSAVAYAAQVPDIVLITNKSNSLQSNQGQSWLNGTYSNAALQRTFALSNANGMRTPLANLPPIGLIDVGRYFEELAKGFDPAVQYMTKVASNVSNITSFPYTLPETTGGDFETRFQFLGQASAFGTNPTVITLTMGLSGALNITKNASFVNACYFPMAGQTICNTLGTWGSTDLDFQVTAKQEHIFVQAQGVTVLDTLSARGIADFSPVISLSSPPASPNMTLVTFVAGAPISRYIPYSETTLFGPLDGSGKSGGNGNNHDASQEIEAVERTLFGAINFCASC